MPPTSLTNRQLEVLGALVVTGSYKEASYQLGITENSVREALARARKRAGRLTTLQLVYLFAHREELERAISTACQFRRDPH